MTMLRSAAALVARAAPRGHARIARIARRALRRPFVATVAPHHLGVGMWVDPADVFQVEVWLGAYQPHVVRFLTERIKPGMTVLTAGAATGYIPLLAAVLAGPSGRVFTAEPDANARALATQNFALNDSLPLAPITLLPFGLSDSTSARRFYRSRTVGHSSFACPHEPDGEVGVGLVTGDAWLAGCDIACLDVLVLDVEGWEVHALRGLSETIRRSPQLVALVEDCPWALESAGEDSATLHAEWFRHGFEAKQWMGQSGDTLFTRNGKER